MKPADGIEEGNERGAESRPSEGGVPVDREGNYSSTIGHEALTLERRRLSFSTQVSEIINYWYDSKS